MANNKKENKIEKFTKEAIGKTLNQFNKEIGMADLVEVNKNQDRILNGILSQVNDESTEKTEKSNIITLDNSTDGIVELKEIQGDTNVNVSKIEEETPITHVIEDKEGNAISLDDITEGAINIDNIQGNTMVNCNKEADKELVLMEDLSTEGYSNITLNKGVDGGLVDVALEGNTMVNVCDQKDPVAITKSYTAETGNHVALQGEYDGKCRPVVTGNTLVNLLDSNDFNFNSYYCTWDGFKVNVNYDVMPNAGNIDFMTYKGNRLVEGNTYTAIINLSGTYSQGTYGGNTFGKALSELTQGINKVVFTYSSSINIFKCWVGGNSETIDYTLEYLLLLEGDYTNKPIPGYFEGLKSSFEDKVVPSPIADIGTCDLSQRANYDVEGDIQIRANTTYTLIYTSSIDTNELLGFQYKEGKKYTYWNNNKKGLNVRVFEADEDKIIWLFGRGTTIEGLIISDIYLFEGDYTSYDFSDYDPTKAGKYKVDYVVTGKNKFDNLPFVKHESSKGNELINLNNGFSITGLANVKTTFYKTYLELSKGTYAVSFDINTPSSEIPINIFFQKNEVFGTNIVNPKIVYESGRYNFTLTLDIDTKIVFFFDVRHTEGIITVNNIQLEEGSTATSYEPYKEQTKTFYLNSPLLEGDTIEQQGDNVVHVHRSEIRAYQTDDELTLPTDMTNTLVAKATPQYEVISQNDTILCDSYTNGHLDVDSVVPIEKIEFLHFEEELTYLYPSTQYTVQFTSDKATTVDITLGGTQLLAQSIVAGLNRINITTLETLVDNKLVIDGVGANISQVVVTEATDQEFGYFEGMKSVGECEDLEVVSCNKNLFDINNMTIGAYIAGGGVAGNRVSIDTSNPNRAYIIIKVKPNTSYTLKSDSVLCYVRGMITEELEAGEIYSYFSSYSFRSGKNTNYYAINIKPSNNEELTLDMIRNSNIQLEEGSTATDYIPHSHNTQTLTHEPLRAVGDIKDKYVLIDGKWYIERNCGEVVLDGSDDEQYDSHLFEGWVNIIVDNLYKYNVTSVVCDKYICKPWNSHDRVLNNTIGGVYEKHDNGTENQWIRIVTRDFSSLSNFKQYLQSDPLTVIYKLQTPVYEPIDYNPFEVYSDITHISNNSTIPCNMIIKNTGYNCLLKPSTTYTVSSNLGLNVVTTPSTLTEDCLRFYDTDTSTVTKMKDVTILEGDWTTKANLIPSNFSGIESAFEQEYDEEKGKYKVKAKVVGKNLFDGEFIKGYFIDSSYAQIDIYRSVELFLKKGTYIISVDSTVTLRTIRNKKDWSIIVNSMSSKMCFTLTEDMVINIYMRSSKSASTIWNLGNNPTDIHLQIEQGTVATPYEPYKENYIEFYIDEPLRGIGDIKDKVYVKDDKVVVERNCGSEVFDGSDDEKWSKSGSYLFDNFVRDWSGIVINCICDKLPSVTYTQSNETFKNIPCFTSQGQSFNIRYIDNPKEWLQQNPLTVVYKLAEPTYEEVEYSSNRLILDTFNNESFNNSTLFLDTNISPKLSFKPLYEELVYVKNSTKYYIQFNAVGSGEVVINLGGTELTTEIVEGYNCIPITTPSESTNLMTISGQGITISEVVVSEVVCGGYYKGLQSCFEEHMENGKYRILLRSIALDGSKVNGIKLYINEPLRGVGDTKDRLCIKNGKLMVERNIAERIVDDTTPINKSITNDKFTRFAVYHEGVRYPDHKLIKCSGFPTRGDSLDAETVLLNTDNIVFAIANARLKSIDVEGFKEWIKEHPQKVQFKVSTTYEEVTNEYGLPIVFEGYENGIVYIDSAVTPTTHIKYTSNNQLATTLAEAEEQNNSTQDDINVNVVTYMMDIDMLLTEMEMSNDISVMAVRRDNSNENMLDRMSEEDKKVYQDNTVVMLEKMITAQALEKEDIERRINMYYDKNRISKEQYKYLKSLL